MGASEKVEAVTHGAPASPWTDEHRAVVIVALEKPLVRVGRSVDYLSETEAGRLADIALAALAPRVAELQRAAKVEALREASNDLFARHKDSPDCGFGHVSLVLDRRADEIEAAS